MMRIVIALREVAEHRETTMMANGVVASVGGATVREVALATVAAAVSLAACGGSDSAQDASGLTGRSPTDEELDEAERLRAIASGKLRGMVTDLKSANPLR
jgi:hypothetical protein